MAKTYSQLLQNIEVLKRQAEERRKKEVSGVIDRIRQAIKFYGLTASDLGLHAASGGVAAGGAARRQKMRRSTARYSDAAGHTWSGRGPRPRWLKEALANGQTLEQLQRQGPGPKAARGKKKGKKSLRNPKFRDAAGNTWGGMGKRPQWLRDALNAGSRLEDFLVARAGESAPEA